MGDYVHIVILDHSHCSSLQDFIPTVGQDNVTDTGQFVSIAL